MVSYYPSCTQQSSLPLPVSFLPPWKGEVLENSGWFACRGSHLPQISVEGEARPCFCCFYGWQTESQLLPLPQTDSLVNLMPSNWRPSAMQTLTPKLGKHLTVHGANESLGHCLLSLYHEWITRSFSRRAIVGLHLSWLDRLIVWFLLGDETPRTVSESYCEGSECSVCIKIYAV